MPSDIHDVFTKSPSNAPTTNRVHWIFFFRCNQQQPHQRSSPLLTKPTKKKTQPKHKDDFAVTLHPLSIHKHLNKTIYYTLIECSKNKDEKKEHFVNELTAQTMETCQKQYDNTCSPRNGKNVTFRKIFPIKKIHTHPTTTAPTKNDAKRERRRKLKNITQKERTHKHSLAHTHREK